MELKFSIQTKINKPINEVFDAVINPKKLTGYFVDMSSGPLIEGKTVIWTWTAHGDQEVKVKQIVENSKIIVEWEALGGDFTTAQMDFTALGDTKTLVKISESGWPATETGLKGSYDNCSGWQHMSMCMKSYLEHGIDLR